MLEELRVCINDIAEPIANSISAQIFELKVNKQNNVIVIDLVVDKARGGINSDECAFVNREISKILEEQDVVGVGYAINVSSPGVDRPLENRRDFMRVVGREVRFHLSEKLEGKLEHAGIVDEVFDDEVKIKVRSEDLVIKYTIINKAVQII